LRVKWDAFYPGYKPEQLAWEKAEAEKAALKKAAPKKQAKISMVAKAATPKKQRAAKRKTKCELQQEVDQLKAEIDQLKAANGQLKKADIPPTAAQGNSAAPPLSGSKRGFSRGSSTDSLPSPEQRKVLDFRPRSKGTGSCNSNQAGLYEIMDKDGELAENFDPVRDALDAEQDTAALKLLVQNFGTGGELFYFGDSDDFLGDVDDMTPEDTQKWLEELCYEPQTENGYNICAMCQCRTRNVAHGVS
jgi:hypothetical protein